MLSLFVALAAIALFTAAGLEWVAAGSEKPVAGLWDAVWKKIFRLVWFTGGLAILYLALIEIVLGGFWIS